MPFLAADIEDALGTLPMRRSVPAARPRLGQFPLSERHKRVRKLSLRRIVCRVRRPEWEREKWHSGCATLIATWYQSGGGVFCPLPFETSKEHLAKPYRFRRYLNQFIVIDVGNAIFEGHLYMRSKENSIV